MITLRIQTVDGVIIKEIQHDEVKTQTFVGDKTHIERKYIKRFASYTPNKKKSRSY